jgi:hypothetical protein
MGAEGKHRVIGQGRSELGRSTNAHGIEIPAAVQSLPWELKKTVAYWERLG